MDAAVEPRNWGDPYIGLRHTAVQIMGLVEKARWAPQEALHGWMTRFGSPTIWEDIAEFLSKVLNILNPSTWAWWLYNSVLKPAWEWFRESIYKPLKDWMQDRITDIMRWFGDISNRIQTAISSIVAPIRDFLVSNAELLRDLFTRKIEAIKDAVWGAITNVVNTVGALKDHVVEALRGVWVGITDRLSSIWEGLKGQVIALRDTLVAAYDRVRDQISGWLSSLWGVLDNFVSTWPGNFLTSIWSGLKMFYNSVVVAIRNAVAFVHAWVLEKGHALLPNAMRLVKEWWGAFESLPGTYLGYVATVAGTDLALQPGRALTTAGSLYQMSILAGALAHGLATILNAIPGTNWVGAAQLSAYVAQAAGFQSLTNATYGVLINDALSVPLRYYWNERLRPRIPTEGEVFLMGRKRGLNRAEFGQAMAYQGLPEWWIEREYRFFWTDPSPYWLLRMSETANPAITPSALLLPWLEEWLPNWRADPWAWYKMKLMLAGFEDTDIAPFIEGFQRRMVSTAVTQVKTSVRAMARNAYWGRSEVEAALRPLGVRQEEIEMLLVAEDLDYQRDYLDDQVTYFQEEFRKGTLSAQDLRLALSTMIIKPARVEQIVAREKVRALPAPKPIVAPKEDPLVTRLRTQAVDSWIKRYRNWEISSQELELGLTIVVRDATLAKGMVEVELTRYRPAPPPPPPPEVDPLVKATLKEAVASWMAAYRNWEISEEELRSGLLGVVKDPDLTAKIVLAERTRYRPPKPAPPPVAVDPLVKEALRSSVASWVARYRAWEITEDQLYFALVRVLADEPLAAKIVAAERTRYREPPAPPPTPEVDPLVESALRSSVASWQASYRAWEITEDQLYAGLFGVLKDEALARKIVEAERTRYRPAPKPPPPPEVDPLVESTLRGAVASWMSRYRDWEISIETLYIELVRVLKDETLARQIVEAERLRYRPPPTPAPAPEEDTLVAKARRQAIASWVDQYRKGQITVDELELGLSGLIDDPEIVRQLVQLEQARAKPTPEIIGPTTEDAQLAAVRDEMVRGHIEMFVDRAIGLEQLYVYFLADGLVEALARATVITQAQKRIKVPPLDSPYFLKDRLRELMDQGMEAYESMFYAGTISLDQYVVWLTGIGVEPELVTYLADNASLNKFLKSLPGD